MTPVSFTSILQNYLDELGRLYLEVDVFLPDGGDPVRPDLSYVSDANRSIVKRHIHGTPDLICEVLSESTARRDLTVKADRYLACGVKEYWIVNPEEKTIEVWFNRQEHWDKVKGERLVSELLTGMAVMAERVFR
jgi:Uma2 family endonuclease